VRQNVCPQRGNSQHYRDLRGKESGVFFRKGKIQEQSLLRTKISSGRFSRCIARGAAWFRSRGREGNLVGSAKNQTSTFKGRSHPQEEDCNEGPSTLGSGKNRG